MQQITEVRVYNSLIFGVLGDLYNTSVKTSHTLPSLKKLSFICIF